MATKASPTRAELTNTLTKILQLLEYCPEKNLKLLTPLLPAYYITLRAIRNFGKQLPRNELQWCENLQTIAPPEELILAKNSSTTEATTQADSSTTEATSQADSSTTEATSQADSSTTEATSQDASGARDASIPTKRRRTYKSIEHSQLINDELITKMLEKNEELKSWTGNPHMFFNPPAIPELQLPETTVDERVKSFYEHAADHTANIEALKLIRRLDSVIAYFRFKRDFISDRIQLPDVQKFLAKIGIPIKQEPKQRALISFGRSLVKFCYTLSGGASFPTFEFDDINFNDIDYGFLFLDLSDKMWDSKRSYYYNMKKKALEELPLRNITKISEQSGAKLAAKSLLQYRQAFIGNLKPQAQSDDQVNNSSPVAPERSSKEANSDSTIALKRSSTKRAHEDSDLDSTRAPKRAREGSDLDSTSTSESAPYNVEANNGTVASEHAPREDRLHVLFQVAKSMDQNEVSSEETIANPISGPHTMQSNNGLSLNSEDSNSVPDPNAQQCLPADPLADVNWDDEVSYINFLDNIIWDDNLVDIRPFTNMHENPLPDTNGQDIYQSLLPEHIIR